MTARRQKKVKVIINDKGGGREGRGSNDISRNEARDPTELKACTKSVLQRKFRTTNWKKDFPKITNSKGNSVINKV